MQVRGNEIEEKKAIVGSIREIRNRRDNNYHSTLNEKMILSRL